MIVKALLAILLMAAVTILLRAAPFLFFSRRKPPALLDYLQAYLPAVVMSLLVAASLKDYAWAELLSALGSLFAGGRAAGASSAGGAAGLAEAGHAASEAFRPLAALAGIAVTAVAHATRRKVLLSIVAGTGSYMLLVRLLA